MSFAHLVATRFDASLWQTLLGKTTDNPKQAVPMQRGSAVLTTNSLKAYCPSFKRSMNGKPPCLSTPLQVMAPSHRYLLPSQGRATNTSERSNELGCAGLNLDINALLCLSSPIDVGTIASGRGHW